MPPRPSERARRRGRGRPAMRLPLALFNAFSKSRPRLASGAAAPRQPKCRRRLRDPGRARWHVSPGAGRWLRPPDELHLPGPVLTHLEGHHRRHRPVRRGAPRHPADQARHRPAAPAAPRGHRARRPHHRESDRHGAGHRAGQRDLSLSPSHHREAVVALTHFPVGSREHDPQHWLRLARAEGWTAQQLRRAMHNILPHAQR